MQINKSCRDCIHTAPELNQAENKNPTTDQKARPLETAPGRYPKGKAIIWRGTHRRGIGEYGTADGQGGNLLQPT